MSKSVSKRIKAAAVSMAMAVSAVPAFALSMPVDAAVSPIAVTAENRGLSKSLEADGKYEGTIPATGAKTVTFTIATEYEGQSFSYGFGCETESSPYWLELNKDGSFVNSKTTTVSGTATKLDKATNTITIDLSDIDAKAGGSYEFRCYYSAHWDNTAGDMVDNACTLTNVEYDAAATTDPDDPEDPETPGKHEFTHNNKQSGYSDATINDNGTITLVSTEAKQLSDLGIVLTRGYDEDYYEAHPEERSDDAPTNSHKFKYTDFGLTDLDGVTIESLNTVVTSDTPLDIFMYGCGLNVDYQSDADTEAAKAGVIKGKDNAGYWYNEMGADSKAEFEAQGVVFKLDEIGEGTTLENSGTWIECEWEVPSAVQACMENVSASDSISFQYWYATEPATEEEEYIEYDGTVTLDSAILTYTIEKTVPYTASIQTAIGKTISCTDTTKNDLKVSYADLGIDETMDVYAIRFDVSATSDIGKLVYNTGTSTNNEKQGYWYQNEADSVVLNAGTSASLLWILPKEVAGNDTLESKVGTDGEVYFGYYYGLADSLTIDNIEVYYDIPETTTTTTITLTTTTTTSTTSTTTTTAETTTTTTTAKATTTTTKATTTTTSATTTVTTTEPATTTTEELKPTLWGDANCDGEVKLGDAVLIMQNIANPNRFGLEGTEELHITAVGLLNADVYENGSNLTGLDALSIQKYLLKLIAELPESYAK